MKLDNVHQPTHYALETVECIDAMAQVFGPKAVEKYAEIAAFKYLWRMNKKHTASKEDKQKAIWYLRYSMGDDPRSSDE